MKIGSHLLRCCTSWSHVYGWKPFVIKTKHALWIRNNLKQRTLQSSVYIANGKMFFINHELISKQYAFLLVWFSYYNCIWHFKCFCLWFNQSKQKPIHIYKYTVNKHTQSIRDLGFFSGAWFVLQNHWFPILLSQTFFFCFSDFFLIHFFFCMFVNNKLWFLLEMYLFMFGFPTGCIFSTNNYNRIQIKPILYQPITHITK